MLLNGCNDSLLHFTAEGKRKVYSELYRREHGHEALQKLNWSDIIAVTWVFEWCRLAHKAEGQTGNQVNLHWQREGRERRYGFANMWQEQATGKNTLNCQNQEVIRFCQLIFRALWKTELSHIAFLCISKAGSEIRKHLFEVSPFCIFIYLSTLHKRTQSPVDLKPPQIYK